MIKCKLFYGLDDELEHKINTFLEENQNIEIIQASFSMDDDTDSIMLLYKIPN
jgi:hypothetical protein